MRILAITIDLDDTLWPVMPALERADRDLDNYLRQHYPQVARTWPIPAMRELRARVAAERLDLAHDFTAQRYITLQMAFDACGMTEAPLDTLWEIYAKARNSVELYPDALPALEWLSNARPVASLTNGNADLARIGLHAHFAHHIAARDIGSAKPNAKIFLAAAERLGVLPENILHVGDDPELDVVGAREAGMRTAWINREGHPWPGALGTAPDLDLPDLAALVDWLHRHDGGA
ncbi:HAD family hydrolase [Dyella mobilis]|uniref:HAD family hydrolase n=1 Tax=Dyella mobilis TaxID=1849582 RepID=A0ABS2KMA9_9GAMM|nr:HAD family hydrolase [Dyella mobilis]MBM7132291.1 HAD family hydrolase [Dyella mobilis]GLQ95722.1 hydrolase [Dyella mobilis]